MRLTLAACLLGYLSLAALPATAQTVAIERSPLSLPPSAFYSKFHDGRELTVPGTNGFEHQWPGTYWEENFVGREVTIGFDDAVNKLHIYVDDTLVDTETKPGRTQVRLSNLGDGPHGEHWIRVEKATESQGAPAVFLGFAAPPSDARPAIAIRNGNQIEFIGDSYTVGYGNTSGKTQCTRDEVWATTDTSQAFGALVAKHYSAAYQINAISGRGIVRNYGGFVADTLPQAYPYTLLDHTAPYADASWQPQIIAIGLGTNDFSTPLHDGEKWKTRDDLHADYEATYVKFVQDLRARNPKAFFILMAADQFHGEMPGEIAKVIARLNAQGERRIAFLPMTGLKFGGCDGHPNTDDDRTVSDELIAFIDQHPDIWQGR